MREYPGNEVGQQVGIPVQDNEAGFRTGGAGEDEEAHGPVNEETLVVLGHWRCNM